MLAISSSTAFRIRPAIVSRSAKSAAIRFCLQRRQRDLLGLHLTLRDLFHGPAGAACSSSPVPAYIQEGQIPREILRCDIAVRPDAKVKSVATTPAGLPANIAARPTSSGVLLRATSTSPNATEESCTSAAHIRASLTPAGSNPHSAKQAVVTTDTSVSPSDATDREGRNSDSSATRAQRQPVGSDRLLECSSDILTPEFPLNEGCIIKPQAAKSRSFVSRRMSAGLPKAFNAERPPARTTSGVWNT
jgi:hypothetical protein